MGLSHRKKFRRYIEFYHTSFGFREPFKVLLDGNFLHQVEHLKQGDAFELMQSGFGRRVRLFCTACIVNELRSLGSEFSASVTAAESLSVHKCRHKPCISAADCLISCIGESNLDHWWVATQDKKLREVLSSIPAVPCLFLTYNGMFVEAPSEASRSAAETKQRKGLQVSEWELSTDALKDLKDLSRHKSPSIFRKKKAQGPNPLSCLKKKKPQEGSDAQEEAPPKTKRRRRKSRTDNAEDTVAMPSNKTSVDC